MRTTVRYYDYTLGEVIDFEIIEIELAYVHFFTFEDHLLTIATDKGQWELFDCGEGCVYGYFEQADE